MSFSIEKFRKWKNFKPDD